MNGKLIGSRTGPRLEPMSAVSDGSPPGVDEQFGGAISATILEAVASRKALTRADIARVLQLAPSTVTVRVGELIRVGLLAETGEEVATGGRRSRMLGLVDDDRSVLAVDLGATHLRVARFSLVGTLRGVYECSVDVTQGPASTLGEVAEALGHVWSGEPCYGMGMSVAGPVNPGGGYLESPARMPAWHRFDVAGTLHELLGVNVIVDNDANLMALGEYVLRARESAGHRDIVFIKAGGSIGAGIVLGGALHRGASYMAGDLAHVRVAAADGIPCSCGGYGCLQMVAGGDAIVAAMAERQQDVHALRDVIASVQEDNPVAVNLARRAGSVLGESLCTVINFVNPDLLVFGGQCSLARPFVEAAAARVREGCHPQVTRNLAIETTIGGPNTALIGAAQAGVRRILAGA